MPLIYRTACTFATGQVIPLAKITRDRFVASLHGIAGAPTGLRVLKGTTESYVTALVFFVISVGFCIHSVRAPPKRTGLAFDDCLTALV